MLNQVGYDQTIQKLKEVIKTLSIKDFEKDEEILNYLIETRSMISYLKFRKNTTNEQST